MTHTEFEKTTVPVATSLLTTLQVSAFQAATPIALAPWSATRNCAEAVELFKQLQGGELDEEQRVATTTLLAEILFPNADDKGMPGLDLLDAEEISPKVYSEAGSVLAKMNEEESFFAQRVRRADGGQGARPGQLADKVGIGQPAISMMLNRSCRPQRKTVSRFAEAWEFRQRNCG